MKCAVSNCHENSLTNGKKLSFFSFPKNVRQARQWKQFCGDSQQINFKYSLICSQHFKADDIIGDLEFVTGMKKKRQLKLGAVPCLKMPQEAETTTQLSKKTIETRKSQRLLNELLEESKSESAEEDSDEMILEESEEDIKPDVHHTEIITRPSPSQIDDHLDNECSEAVIDELTNQNETLRLENMRLKVNMQVAQKNYKRDIKDIKKHLEKANFYMTEFENHLGTVCTIQQMKKIKINMERRWIDKILNRN